jgi:5-methylcytosine-specific restriction endonuclease McrA
MSKWDTNVAPYMTEIEDWAGHGASTKEIAEKLGVGHSTLRQYVKEYQELSAALKRGKSRAKRVVEKALAQKDTPGIKTTGGAGKVTPYVKSATPRPDQQGRHRGPYERAKKRIYRTQEVCGICGKPVDKSLRYPHPLAPCIDHIVPIAKGGHPSDIGNLQLAHWTCNRQKSDKLLAVTQEHKAVEVISNRVLPQSADWAAYRSGRK